VGAGTGITVNANDVQLATIAAESFFGRFFATAGAPAARAGNDVAGGGLTYSAGGTLAVGAGSSMTVNANDVAYSGTDSLVPETSLSGNVGTINIASLACGGTVSLAGATATFQVEGFTAKTVGFWFRLRIQTNGGFDCTLLHEDATATAANRITCPYSLDMTLPGEVDGIMYYDSTSRWVWLGDPPLRMGRTSAHFVSTVGSTIDIQSASSNVNITAGSSAPSGSGQVNITSGGDTTIVSGEDIVLEHEGGDHCIIQSTNDTGGFLVLESAASSLPAVAALNGMFWAESTTPTRPRFTDGADDDYLLSYAYTNVQLISGTSGAAGTIALSDDTTVVRWAASGGAINVDGFSGNLWGGRRILLRNANTSGANSVTLNPEAAAATVAARIVGAGTGTATDASRTKVIRSRGQIAIVYDATSLRWFADAI
jgi:hypothetical protein